MSIEGVAQKSNKSKNGLKIFAKFNYARAITVSLTLMLAAFVIPPLSSSYSSMTNYNSKSTRVIEMEAGHITAFYQNPM
ncbi:MAG: hypothetical protein ACTHKF_02175 [Candidatus Nitrosocosmicus sp.]